MLCRNPYIQGLAAFPCGRCEPCLLKRKRVWTHRILLESHLSCDNAFVTLTYAEDNLPAGASLVKKDYQDWLKRLRFVWAPQRVRYFVVGEYGDEGGRPHYHAALFGFPSCRHGNTKRTLAGRPDPENCCSICRTLHSTWQHGLIDTGELNIKSARYISGYVTKKMTHRHHPWLNGRDPEFANMSLKPGLGLGIVKAAADTLLQYDLSDQGDVPVTLSHGKIQMPLGRYLRQQMRKAMGNDPKAPIDYEQQAEVYKLLYTASRSKEFVSPKTALTQMDDGKIAAMAAKAKIFKKRQTL